jgi:hypothetical protein
VTRRHRLIACSALAGRRREPLRLDAIDITGSDVADAQRRNRLIARHRQVAASIDSDLRNLLG